MFSTRSCSRMRSFLSQNGFSRRGLSSDKYSAVRREPRFKDPYTLPALSRSFPAIFARGGTSNGLVILRRNLPPEDQWEKVLPAAMGSPDHYGRQLDGMGSGISSTSKICVLSPSTRPDADVDFTFVQVGIKDGRLDKAGNCGNLSAIVGPVSLDEDLVPFPTIEEIPGDGGCSDGVQQGGPRRRALVRIFNTNTSKVIHSRFDVVGVPPIHKSTPRYKYNPYGTYEMDGVPRRNSAITQTFLSPSGAKTGKALPTGNPIDDLALPDGSSIAASLVDVSNPGVFIRVSDLQIPDVASLDPAKVEADRALMARLEHIRQAGAARMGLDPQVLSVPKVVLLFPGACRPPGVDVRCLALSMGQAHKAVPLTLALCLGAAAKMAGTIPNQLVAPEMAHAAVLAIGHPSGKVDIGTEMVDGEITSVNLHRTGRVLMKGDVFY